MSMQKLTIFSPETGTSVSGTFNPKELAYDKDAGWAEDSNGFGADMQAMQFTNGKSIKLSIEMFFDLYESQGDVRPLVQSLLSFTMVNQSLQRPPVVAILWGKNIVLSCAELIGVVQSVNTKYTMFLPNGTPCRATSTINFVQAQELVINGGGTQTTDVVSVTPKNATSEQLGAIVDSGEDPVENFNKSYDVSVTSTTVNTNSGSSAGSSKSNG